MGRATLNGYERNPLFWNRGDGTYHDVGHLTGANRIEDGRGIGVSDFDGDGQLDMVLANWDAPTALLMGRGDVGRSLRLELRGTTSNRDAIGAVVRVRTPDGRWQTQHVAAGRSFLSSSSPVLHFGLGEADRVEEIRVRWPTGHEEVLDGLPAGRHEIVEATLDAG